MAPHAQRVHALVSRVQVLAGSVAVGEPAAVLDRFEQLSEEIPEPVSHAERVLFGRILADALVHLGRALRVAAPGGCDAAVDAASFMRELGRLKQATAVPLCSRRIAQFHELMRQRFADPELTAKAIASDMGLSVWYLTRTVKRETHHGFCWHLRSARVARAAQLLMSTTKSVKEIAHEVGYRHAGELDRQFRAVHGMTPTAFRCLPHH